MGKLHAPTTRGDRRRNALLLGATSLDGYLRLIWRDPHAVPYANPLGRTSFGAVVVLDLRPCYH